MIKGLKLSEIERERERERERETDRDRDRGQRQTTDKTIKKKKMREPRRFFDK